MSKSLKNEKWGVGGYFQENQQPRGRAWPLVRVADERLMKGKRLDDWSAWLGPGQQNCVGEEAGFSGQ